VVFISMLSLFPYPFQAFGGVAVFVMGFIEDNPLLHLVRVTNTTLGALAFHCQAGSANSYRPPDENPALIKF
jgi:hypothetical protein